LSDFRVFPIVFTGNSLTIIQLIDVVGAIGFSVMQITYASWVNEQFREALEMRNQESESTNQLLKSALSTRDQLFNMLAHDLRSPFVSLESGLIILEDVEIPENKQWIVKEIRDNARNTLTLLDNTLNWARSQTNNIRFEPQEFLLQDLLNKIHQNFQLNLRAKGIHLHLETIAGLEVYADPNMLQSILHNLISNAIKFSPKDSNIWISVISRAEGIEFRVRDSGTGMSQEEISLILSGETFSKPGTRKEKGHGVGLLLVREFLQKHGTSLSIRSAPGMGTEMSFLLKYQSRSI
jgi:signal transduction histidine kinase